MWLWPQAHRSTADFEVRNGTVNLYFAHSQLKVKGLSFTYDFAEERIEFLYDQRVNFAGTLELVRVRTHLPANALYSRETPRRRSRVVALYRASAALQNSMRADDYRTSS
jgi:hypothetical protein